MGEHCARCARCACGGKGVPWCAARCSCAIREQRRIRARKYQRGRRCGAHLDNLLHAARRHLFIFSSPFFFPDETGEAGSYAGRGCSEGCRVCCCGNGPASAPPFDQPSISILPSHFISSSLYRTSSSSSSFPAPSLSRYPGPRRDIACAFISA